MILTGAVNYAMSDATAPTDHAGAVSGALTAAALAVNFASQTADFSLAATMPGQTWTGVASNITLHGDGSFYAHTGDWNGDVLPGQKLIVTMTNTILNNTYSSETIQTANAWGNVAGSLFRADLAAAGLVYSFGANDFYTDSNNTKEGGTNNFVAINGAVTFDAAAQNLNTPYKGVFLALGYITPSDVPVPGVPGTFVSPEDFDDRYKAYVDGGFHASGNITDTQLEGSYPVFFLETWEDATVHPRTAEIPVTYAMSGSPSDAQTFTYADGSGSISWGRWAAVDVTVTARTGGAPTLLSDISGAPPFLHYLTTSEQTGPVALPLTGTATYALVGGTSPTDNYGAVGTLGAATLAANFTAKTVDFGINLNMPAVTDVHDAQAWNANAVNVPIQNGAYFEAGGNSSSALAVSCTNCVTANTGGQVMGAFTGTQGQGAAMTYSLGTGTTATNAVVVSGVAAFTR